MAVLGAVEIQTASEVTTVDSPEPLTRVTESGSAVPAARVAPAGQTSSLPGSVSATSGASALAPSNRTRIVAVPASAPSTSPALGPSPARRSPAGEALQLAAPVRSTTVPSGQCPTTARRVRDLAGNAPVAGTISRVGVPAGARTSPRAVCP